MAHTSTKEILEGFFGLLNADTQLASLLSAVGAGSNKIRFVDQIDDTVNPAVAISLVSDAPDGSINLRHATLIQVDTSMRSSRVQGSDTSDPMEYVLDLSKRVREVVIGGRAKAHNRLPLSNGYCAHITEDSETPLRKDTGRDSEFWVITQTYRVQYIR